MQTNKKKEKQRMTKKKEKKEKENILHGAPTGHCVWPPDPLASAHD